MTGIPIVIGALGTVPKGFERGLGEMEIGGCTVEISQNTEKSWRSEGTCRSDSCERLSADPGVKNWQGVE